MMLNHGNWVVFHTCSIIFIQTHIWFIHRWSKSCCRAPHGQDGWESLEVEPELVIGFGSCNDAASRPALSPSEPSVLLWHGSCIGETWWNLTPSMVWILCKFEFDLAPLQLWRQWLKGRYSWRWPFQRVPDLPVTSQDIPRPPKTSQESSQNMLVFLKWR
jgi:hypothetical protein